MTRLWTLLSWHALIGSRRPKDAQGQVPTTSCARRSQPLSGTGLVVSMPRISAT
ncbi:hypothetical protein FFLO_07168 [Filobasidium floriforme]|uniref:Uncharacterized protein n=1 Tax=Filobasidium floriforme TaxID=5210 RepID=A0A8K0JJ66_9TREE|nr:hypothetical protein FFLO_07168 [Filobasidium floriforme]